MFNLNLTIICAYIVIMISLYSRDVSSLVYLIPIYIVYTRANKNDNMRDDNKIAIRLTKKYFDLYEQILDKQMSQNNYNISNENYHKLYLIIYAQFTNILDNLESILYSHANELIKNTEFMLNELNILVSILQSFQKNLTHERATTITN